MKLKIVSKPTPKPAAVRGAKDAAVEPMGCDFYSAFTKTFKAVKDAAGNVVDYKDVKITGYLSTFNGVDRDGDTVKPGAFAKTIPEFMKNPVLLLDHVNDTDHLAGKFTRLQEDAKGLKFEAQITNSPSEKAKDIRHKVVNGELSTCSMGGAFLYGDTDEKGVKPIHQVALFEGSLTPIPANPEATFNTRALKDDLMKKALSEFKRMAVPGRKMMDKPSRPGYTILQDGHDPMAQGDPMDLTWGAQRLSAHANDMQEWATDQDNDDAHNEAAATHEAIHQHFTVLAAKLDAAGHSLSAFRSKRLARYHKAEADYIRTKCMSPDYKDAADGDADDVTPPNNDGNTGQHRVPTQRDAAMGPDMEQMMGSKA